MLEEMKKTFNGEPVHGPALTVWPGTEGGPQMMLGAWRSPRWINLAASYKSNYGAADCYGADGIHPSYCGQRSLGDLRYLIGKAGGR